MRKIVLYIATSLNGKIVRQGGEVDWLEKIPNPQADDYGYSEFYNSIDTTIMGATTYRQIVAWDFAFPYRGKTNYVLTRGEAPKSAPYVHFISGDPLAFIKNLKATQGKDIWLIGGGQVNTLLFNAHLIDEIQMHIMPIVIPDGIDLFQLVPDEKQLLLKDSIAYPSGVVGLKYGVVNKNG